MRGRFTLYLLCVTLVASLMSWGDLLARATGGRGSGNSWFSHSSGGGFGSTGGWAGSMGGGHK